MLRNLISLALIIILLAGCINNVKTSKATQPEGSQKPDVVKSTQADIPLTDSAKLVKHLDSLPKSVFPQNISDWKGTPSIDLSEFKTKVLFKLSYKRIHRVIGGAQIDGDRIDSTFNLCDTNYKASWLLIVKTPRFFVVAVDENYTHLATIDYDLNVIDAIHVAAGDPSSNDHFQGELSSTIYKNLKIVMHYSYTQQGSKEENYRTENEISEDDIWRIDKRGHFKAIRYRPDGVANF